MVLLLCLFLLFVLKCPHQILSFACHFGRSSAAGLVIRRLFYLISFRNPPLIICLLAPPGIVTYIFRRAHKSNSVAEGRNRTIKELKHNTYGRHSSRTSARASNDVDLIHEQGALTWGTDLIRWICKIECWLTRSPHLSRFITKPPILKCHDYKSIKVIIPHMVRSASCLYDIH